MVEGGSILHADHPRKWVIFARRFTVGFCVCGQDASFHELEAGFLHPVDQFIRRGPVCPAETVFQFFLVLLFGVMRSVPTYVDQVPVLF